MWCWAACIEMVLKYHGFDVPQKDIVARTFGTDALGNPPAFAGATLNTITANLNGRMVDRLGRPFTVSAYVTPSAIPDRQFLYELGRREPLIIAYGPNINSGHVVVLTAASFVQTHFGDAIRTIVVRDPWPTPYTVHTRGRLEYLNGAPPPQGLPWPVQAVWFIDVTPGH